MQAYVAESLLQLCSGLDDQTTGVRFLAQQCLNSLGFMQLSVKWIPGALSPAYIVECEADHLYPPSVKNLWSCSCTALYDFVVVT
jgi:hypothetical protein